MLLLYMNPQSQKTIPLMVALFLDLNHTSVMILVSSNIVYYRTLAPRLDSLPQNVMTLHQKLLHGKYQFICRFCYVSAKVDSL